MRKRNNDNIRSFLNDHLLIIDIVRYSIFACDLTSFSFICISNRDCGQLLEPANRIQMISGNNSSPD
ncbi:hypothetical protein D3C78_1872910 [compost metagenome]